MIHLIVKLMGGFHPNRQFAPLKVYLGQCQEKGVYCVGREYVMSVRDVEEKKKRTNDKKKIRSGGALF